MPPTPYVYIVTLSTAGSSISFKISATSLAAAQAIVDDWVANYATILLEDGDGDQVASVDTDYVTSTSVSDAGLGAQTDVVHVEDDRIRITLQ